MKKIAIIGFGRFGELLADILKNHGQVHIMSQSGHSGAFPLIGKQQLGEMDWVIPAVPISALEQTLQDIASELKPDALVMDVCSVKVKPCEWLFKHVPAGVEIIGSHPMFGPDSAKNGLKGLQVVLCPLRAAESTVEEVREVFRKLELKIIETSADEHDRQAANCLAMVHFLGRGLDEMKLEKQEITTMGFERLLAVNETVANDTWQLFLDMQYYNPYAAVARKALVSALETVEAQILADKRE
ncbi:prephenate dehydrogenase/arogenate dehydrogenase family protein [Candidatus Falkowbacteria bacterium]|nr:prephenate dehydrogenase/arogenate dehydrogenase family protein [Candidatus Falkowbacteria bacterium]